MVAPKERIRRFHTAAPIHKWNKIILGKRDQLVKQSETIKNKTETNRTIIDKTN